MLVQKNIFFLIKIDQNCFLRHRTDLTLVYRETKMKQMKAEEGKKVVAA